MGDNENNIGVVTGENNADNNNSVDTATSAQNVTETAKTYTADEYTAAVEKAKTEAVEGVYKALGIKQGDNKTVELLKAIIDTQSKQNSRKETAATNAENERRVQIAEAKAEVVVAGINKAFIDDAVTLILAKGDTSDMKTSVAELKTKYPAWFEVSAEAEGTGKAPQEQKKEVSSKSGIGARLAAKRSALNANKKSVWG